MNDPRMLALIEILSDSKKWLTAREITGQALRMQITLPARIIGDLASASNGEIIGHGKGYKLMKNATDEDILEAYAADLRRAMGGEQRARQIIAFARSHGRLRSESDIRKVAEREKMVADEVKKPSPTHPEQTKAETYEEVSLF